MIASQQVHQSSSSEQGNEPISPTQIDLSQYIPPPNPITTKTFQTDQKQSVQNLRRRHFFHSPKILRSQWVENEQVSLRNFYAKQILIFQKFHNKHLRQRNGVEYASSAFLQNVDVVWEKMKYVGMFKNDSDVQFDSNYQSANLFQVYKTGDYEYDLVLQNDVNTTGYAQWFNFKIKNKERNISIKMNIVNMYKSGSLYQKGMKPLASSLKQGKKWHRNTYQVQYYENQIPTERDPNKCYHTLSFCYEFKHESDEVQFCHFYPYTSVDCQNFLENINGSSKIRIKNLGNSALRKPIPIIQLFSDSGNVPQKLKRALVIVGRQHSGETQSSFLIEEIVYTLLGNNSESEFLLDKFDIYVCPMLNIDGVCLGNYRTNAYGYDLNRYWHTENQLKIPEILYFKSFINNLKKRTKIALILDLHGHSKKLNSFFYGNPFGKNYMMLPFIASKLCDMIKFKSCTFKEEKFQKSKTARAVLGNLLKDTAYIYTFEVSFWGCRKNNRVVPYILQNLKQLGKTLVSSIYKVFMQEIKEDITLKESVFFKQINKEINSLTDDYFDKESGSDSEAQNLTLKEDFQRTLGAMKTDKLDQASGKNQTSYNSRQVGIQVDFHLGTSINLKSPQVLIYTKEDEEKKKMTQSQIKVKYYECSPQFSQGSKGHRSSKTKQLLISRQTKKKQEQAFYHLAYDNHFQTKQNFYFHSPQNKQLSSTSRKQFLLQKLRVFGETFVENLQPQNKKNIIGKRSIGVQVPELNLSQNKLILDSIILRKMSDKIGNLDNLLQNNNSKNKNSSKNSSVKKSQKNKDFKKFLPKKKSYSLVLNKPAIQDIIQITDKSQQKYPLARLQKDTTSFIIKVSKSPIVRIQKFTNSNNLIGNEFKQRQNIYDNINRLKSNITALKREYSQRLPQIETSNHNIGGKDYDNV